MRGVPERAHDRGGVIMMALRRISWIGLAFRFDPIGAGTNLPPARIIT